VQSTQTLPLRRCGRIRATSSATSREVGRQLKITSAIAAASRLAAVVPQAFAWASALLAVRFQTSVGKPARCRLQAMG